MPRRRRPFPALAATLVTVALLVGCGVDSDPEVATTDTSETTESTEPPTTTTTASTTTEPSDDGPGDGIGDDDGTIDDDRGDDSTTDDDSGDDGTTDDGTIDDDGGDDGTDGTDGGEFTAFCEANADLEQLDDELGAAIDEEDVAGFQRLYSEYLDAVDAAAAVAPGEIVDAVNEVSDILFQFIDEVEQATTVAELNAIPDDPAFDVEAFDEVESYTDANC